MKKIFRKIGLSLAALACVVCAGVGISLGNANSQTAAASTKTIAASDYYMSGAGIRLINDAHGTGIRFHTALANTEYAELDFEGGVKTGTLVIPEIRYDGDLTLEDMGNEAKYRPVHIDTTDVWYASLDDDGNPIMKSTAYLYDIPDHAYGARYVARSYIQYADGTVAYAYTSAERWVSMTDVANKVTAEEGQTTQIKTQVAPFIVSNTTVTYDMPDGEVSETVGYGAVATPDDTISYNTSLYQINSWTDQYGRAWNIAKDVVTMPITLTPTFSAKADTALSSALSTTHSTSPLTEYTGTDDRTVAPTGFANVTRYDTTKTGAIWVACYNNVDLSAYNDVWFAIKIVNGTLKTQLGDKATSSWVYFHLTQTATSVWTIEMTIDGEVYQTQTEQSGTEIHNTAVQKANSLATILYGNSYGSTDGAYVMLNNNSGKTMTLYSTEVQVNRADLTGMPAVGATVITDENGEQIWALRDDATDDHTHEFVGTDTTAAPKGFTQVKRYDSNTETGDDGNAWTSARAWVTSYDDTDLSKYSEVWFAVTVDSGPYISDNKNPTFPFSGTWVYLHLIQTADSTWTIEVVVNGEVKATYVGHNGKAGGAFGSVNSIGKILYYTGSAGDGVYFFVYKSSASRSIYSTEVLGVLKDTDVGTEDTETEVNTIVPSVDETTPVYDVTRVSAGALTIDSALSTTHSTSPLTEYTAGDDTTAAPWGFNKVTRYDTTKTGTMWVAGYNNVDISAYKDVWFAIKIVNGTLKTQLGDKATSSWIYFHLTQVANSLWTIEIEMDGEIYATFENQSGTEVNSSSTAVQKANTIATILYGNGYGSTDGAYVMLNNTSGATMTLYSTELRADRGDRAVWSAFDGAAISAQENATFDGYESFYKITGFTPSMFSKLDLTGKGYTYVRFAFWMWHTCTMKIDNRTITINSWHDWYVTLTATADGWSVKLDVNQNNVTTAYTFTTTAKSLKEIFAGMTFTGTTTSTTAYCTEVRAVHICSGGEATCTESAKCAYCGNAYGVAKGHGEKVWVDNVYQCEDCGEVYGNVNTALDGQDVVLFENATAATFNAQSANAVIDLSGITDRTIASTETTVTLGGEEYAATIAENTLTFTVKPQDVFGDYIATFALTVEGKEFEITAPVLVITNQITTTAGLQAMKEVLRGANLATATETGIGGIGGENTMNGDGYYTLGCDVAITTQASEYTLYRGFAFGTSKVPFIGVFDGRGYAVSNFRTNGASWAEGYAYQDYTSTAFGSYLESSLFGVMDGTVKNVAFTNAKFGSYANLIHSGSGTVQDVYVQVTDIQHHAYSGSVAPFFMRADTSTAVHGTLRNVVFDYSNHASLNADAIIKNNTSVFAAATGKNYTAQNVAVYNFFKDGITTDGARGNVYVNTVANKSTDGSAEGIYVTYVDGTSNGGAFTLSALHDELWTVVNGVPTFKNLAADGTETAAPSTSEEEVGELGYYIAWDSDSAGAYEAVALIKSVTKTSTGKTLVDGAVKANAAGRNQIIIGSYNEYMSYLATQPTLMTNGCANFGVYHVETENGGNTLYVLADNEDSLTFAAKELCRKLYGYEVYSPDSVCIEAKSGIEIPADFDYTTYLAFAARSETNTMTGEQKAAMGLSTQGVYSSFIEMHNALDYLAQWDGDEENNTYGFVREAYTDENALSVDGPDDNNTTDGEQLCYLARGDKTSFDNLVDRVYGIMIEYAEECNWVNTINLMMEDNVDYCACSACAQFSAPSIPHLLFLNEVAKKLQSNEVVKAREIKIEFMSYAGYGKAPVLTESEIANLDAIASSLGIEYETATFSYDTDLDYTPSTMDELTVLKAEENVRLLWTTQGANHAFALKHMANDHMYEALQGWIAALGADNVDAFMYQTVYGDYFLPLNTWAYQVEWYRQLSELGLHTSISNLGDMYNEVGSQTAFGAFKTYINSRVMADVNVEYETLKEEFFAEDGYYGEGGPMMLEFFNELEEVMNSKKQTGENPSDYLDYTTFRWVSSDNVGTSYTDRRQAFLNGEYHYQSACVLFSHWTTNSGTLWQELYSGNGRTQQDNLERWYRYCQDALGEVTADSVYADRITMEQFFPEYAFLVLQTTYTTASGLCEVAVLPSSSVITTSYQQFYDKVKYVITSPSEFYEYNSTKTTDVYDNGWNWDDAYQSFFKTWGVA